MSKDIRTIALDKRKTETTDRLRSEFMGVIEATRYTGADNRYGANAISMRMALSLVRSLANRMAYDCSMMKPSDIDAAAIGSMIEDLDNAAAELRSVIPVNLPQMMAAE